MASIKVSISSRSTIKPSSATPPHLRRWKLSMIDQFIPNVHIPFILFYSPSPSHPPAAIVAHLKLSLSHALTKFYPLAGRLRVQASEVDCSNQGVDFFEAQVAGVVDLAGFLLRNPGPDLLRQLVPLAGPCTARFPEGVILSVQATVFNCGGVSLGLCISHKIADGVSFLCFLQSWAASTTTTGGGDVVQESSYFPSLEFFIPETDSDLKPTQITVQRRFVLDGPHLTALRSTNRLLVPGATHFPTPTRVEVVTGLFWRAIIRARPDLRSAGEGLPLNMFNLRKLAGLGWSVVIQACAGLNPAGKGLALHIINLGKLTWLVCCGIILFLAGHEPAGKGMAIHMVNLRNHMTVPRVETLLGNFAIPVVLTEEEGANGSWRRLGLELGNAVRELSYEKLQAARGPGRLMFFVEIIKQIMRLPMRCSFSSWCRFPVYEVDFGWGKPAWAAFGGAVLKQFVVLVDRKEDEGVEVWVSLEKEEMDRLIRDQELLSHVSLC